MVTCRGCTRACIAICYVGGCNIMHDTPTWPLRHIHHGAVTLRTGAEQAMGVEGQACPPHRECLPHVAQEKRLLQVPWGSETIVQVMFFWVLAFCFLGCCVMPVGLDLLGLDRADLTPRLEVGTLQIMQLNPTESRVKQQYHESKVICTRCVQLQWAQMRLSAALSALLSWPSADPKSRGVLRLKFLAMAPPQLSHLALDVLQMGAMLLWVCIFVP